MVRRLTVLLLGVVSISVLSGCGGAAYDSLLNRRLDQLRAGAPFRNLWAPTQLEETPISIRVPMAFRDSYKVDSGHKDDDGRIRPDRFQPPFLPLPGMKICYEGKAPDPEGTELPFYCYLAVAPQGDADALRAELQAKLKETFKDAPEQWENVDATSPTEKAVSWKKLRVAGPQAFLVGKPPEIKVLPGVFELWVHDAGEQTVIMAWRAPTSIDAPADASKKKEENPLLQLTQPGKPDLSSMPALAAGTLLVQQQTAEAAK